MSNRNYQTVSAKINPGRTGIDVQRLGEQDNGATTCPCYEHNTIESDSPSLHGQWQASVRDVSNEATRT